MMKDVWWGLNVFSSWVFIFVVLEKMRVRRRSGRGFRLRQFSVGRVWLSAASRSGWPGTASTVPLTSGRRREGEIKI